MKGIILAGGSGTRMYPLTRVHSKQLLPVYDKPMIYYPLSVLMLSGIKDILVISTVRDMQQFELLLGDGSQWGVKFTYAVQPSPNGIVEAFIIGENFLAEEACGLILGDNIFYGHDLHLDLMRAVERSVGATLFAYPVHDPERYGVVEFNQSGQVMSLEEKPLNPRSKYAVTGLYLYDNNVVELSKSIQPSERGELEITDLNKVYLDNGLLNVEVLGRGIAWLDTGTHDSLLEAAHYIQTIEKRQGLKIACPEEIAWRQGWIDDEHLSLLSEKLINNSYGRYLNAILNSHI